MPESLKENAAVSTPQVSEGLPKKKNSGTKALLWLTLSILVLAIAWLFYWFLYLQYYQFTDDAYANGNMVNVNPAVAGSVIAYYADDTELVTEGMLLVKLDDTQYQASYAREVALLASTTMEVSQLYDKVLVAQANVELKKTQLAKTQYDYDNREALIDSQAISNEDFVHSKDDLLLAQNNLTIALRELKLAIDAAGQTKPGKHPRIEVQKERVREAYYRLKHCSIYAPATGYIAQRNVEVGQWVVPSLNLMAIIPTDYVWVDANFKETQLKYMRVGQPATVRFDIYGSGVSYKGKVLGIASGSGSVFSLIPPQNATGNWIKIVQRLPVRISLDPEIVRKYPTRLGISAEVYVDITDQDLPMLAMSPPTSKPIATTKIYDLDFQELNKDMERIVQEKLGKNGG